VELYFSSPYMLSWRAQGQLYLQVFTKRNKFQLLSTSRVWPSCLNTTLLVNVLNVMAERIHDLIKWSNV
jgi:hypothetical protein